MRSRGIPNIEEPIIICNEQHIFIVAEQMREIKVKPKSIIFDVTKINRLCWMAKIEFDEGIKRTIKNLNIYNL